MPIKGLTHQRPSFPEIGRLRKGKKDDRGNVVDLDYFRFTSNVPGVEELFYSFYPQNPRLINILLPHKTTDENWSAWYEEWVASGLIHRCDGEFIIRYRDKRTGKYIDPPPESMRCPYCSGEKERTQSQGCHPKGRLKVIIPELERLAYVTVLTGAFNDIPKLDSQLRALEEARGDLRGIPMQLRRRPESISTPKAVKKDGKWVQTADRLRRESWLLSIEAAPDWVSLQLESQRIAALPEVPEAYRIEAPSMSMSPEVDTPPEDIEEGEFVGAPVVLSMQEALEVGIPKDAPKLGLKAGQPLRDAVALNAEDLIVYLSMTSSYDGQSEEVCRLILAAETIMDNWSMARNLSTKEDKGGGDDESGEEPVEEQPPKQTPEPPPLNDLDWSEVPQDELL